MGKRKLFLKGIIIFVMTLAVWVPTYFIVKLIKEGEVSQKENIDDISKWSGWQLITGPLFIIPYPFVGLSFTDG